MYMASYTTVFMHLFKSIEKGRYIELRLKFLLQLIHVCFLKMKTAHLSKAARYSLASTLSQNKNLFYHSFFIFKKNF